MKPVEFFSLTGLLLALSLPGCSGEEEAAHLEHSVPAHKPHSFAEAVEELIRRSQQVNPVQNPREFEELRDIVRWIPELAADSDLPEPDWTTACIAAEELSRALDNLQTSSDPESLADISQPIKTLDTLVEAAGLPEPEPPHHDHHDHHDEENPVEEGSAS